MICNLLRVANILAKLHLTDRTQATIFALQQHLMPLKDGLDKDKGRGNGLCLLGSGFPIRYAGLGSFHTGGCEEE